MILLLAALCAGHSEPVPVAEPPHALLSFFKSPKSWDMTLEMTTVSGAKYEIIVNIRKWGYRFQTQTALNKANWLAEPTDDGNIKIWGVRTKDGKGDAVKSLSVTNKITEGAGQTPKLSSIGEIKVETREDDGMANPPMVKRPPTGPDMGEEPYVEIDFAPMPLQPGVSRKLKFLVETVNEKHSFTLDLEASGSCKCDELAEDIVALITDDGFKVELVEKTKVRVYGGVVGGKYYPAVRGAVASPNLKPALLPKVTNSPRRDG